MVSGGVLGLKLGDILVGVDSKLFCGNVVVLNKWFKVVKGCFVVLIFWWDKIDVIVMVEYLNFGKWEVVLVINDWLLEF